MSEDPRPDETAAPSVDQEAAEFVPSKFQRSRGRFVERSVVVQGLMAKLRELVTSTSKKMIARRQWSRDELRHAARFSAAASIPTRARTPGGHTFGPPQRPPPGLFAGTPRPPPPGEQRPSRHPPTRIMTCAMPRVCRCSYFAPRDLIKKELAKNELETEKRSLAAGGEPSAKRARVEPPSDEAEQPDAAEAAGEEASEEPAPAPAPVKHACQQCAYTTSKLTKKGNVTAHITVPRVAGAEGGWKKCPTATPRASAV